jgi:hypothetical protein
MARLLPALAAAVLVAGCGTPQTARAVNLRRGRILVVDSCGVGLGARGGLLAAAGPVFAAAHTHKFAHLANAIDTAFARWDRSHLYQFVLADGRQIGLVDDDDELDLIDGAATPLATLELGEQFYYEFDFGDGWTHLCTVGPSMISPLDTLGIRPSAPLPYFGWGTFPDQYGRRWAEDVGEGDVPSDPGGVDLPPGFPW